MSITEDNFNKGTQAYLAGDYVSAETAFLKVLEFDPHASEVMLNLGNVYFKKKDFQKAQSFWEKAVTLNPLEDKCYLNLGNLYYSKKLYAKAVYQWEIFKKLNHDNLNVHFNLGLAYEALGNLKESYHNYQIFISKSNDNEASKLKKKIEEARRIAQHNIIQAENLMQTGKLEKAKIAYENSVLIYPLSPKSYQHYATLLYRLNKLSESARWYEVAYKELPNEIGILINLGVIYEKLDDPFQALWAFCTAMRQEAAKTVAYKIKSHCESLWRTHGDGLMKEKLEETKKLIENCRYEEAEHIAKRMWDIVFNREPNSLPSIKGILEFLEERKDPKKQAANIAYTLAEDFRNKGQYEKALKYYERYLEILPRGDKAQEIKDKQEQISKIISAVINSMLAIEENASQPVA